MDNEDQLIDSSVDDGLTDEERAADAAAMAADMGPFFAPLLQAKRAKQAKTGHRKKRDKRFRLFDGEAEGPASPTGKNCDEPWDSEPADATDEIVRISQIVHPYLDPRCAVSTFRAGMNRGELILKIFDGRPQSIDNLKRLYAFTRRRHKNGLRPFDSPVVELIESILIKEGAIQQPASEWAAGDPKTWIEYDSEEKIK